MTKSDKRETNWVPHTSTAEHCARTQEQNCHHCENADCGDNTTPGIVALKAELADARSLMVHMLQANVEGVQERDDLRARLAAAERNLAMLHGRKFSERCYTALVARAESAERDLTAARKALEATLDAMRSARDKWGDGYQPDAAWVAAWDAARAALKDALAPRAEAQGDREASHAE